MKIAIVGMATFGANEAGWPAPVKQYLCSFFFATVGFEEGGQADSFLQLYGVLLHDHILLFSGQFHYAEPRGSIDESR